MPSERAGLRVGSGLVALVLAIGILVAPSADALITHFQTMTATSKLTRQVDGKPVVFDLRLDAASSEDYDEIVVTVTRRKDAPGTSRTFSETQSWRKTDLHPNTVVFNGLQKVRVNSGMQLGDWGKIQGTFNATGPASEPCEGVGKRPGTFTKTGGDTFRFKTGNSVIGKITEVPPKASARDDDCFGGTSGSCPNPIRLLAGATATMSLHSVKRSATSLVLTHYRNNGKKSRLTSVAGRLPRSALMVSSDLTEASLTIPDKTPFVKGSISIVDPGPKETGDYIPCGDDKEFREISRSGDAEGKLVMPVTGAEALKSGGDLRLYPRKYQIHPAP